MESLDIDVKQVNTFPLVKHYMDQLGVHQLFKDSIPSSVQAQTHPADGLSVLIVNLISAANPLYKVEQWVSEHIDGLHSEPEKGLKFNDDFLGGCLDKLFKADRNSLLARLSAKAIEIHDLKTDALHNDTTSVTVYGEYEGGNSNAVQLKHGYNKDGKPDCKQLVFGLTVIEDGHVPIQGKIYDGNQTDDRTHIDVWKELRKNLGKSDFIYVADCKLCSIENMTTIASYGGFFITIIPSTRSEVKIFKEKLLIEDIAWKKAFQKESSRKKGIFDVYKTYEGETSAEGYRIIWVHSSSKQEADASRRNAKIVNTEDALKTINQKINTYYLKTDEQIRAAIADAIKGVEAFFSIKITEKHNTRLVKKGKGRPSDNSEYIEKEEITYTLSWKRNIKEIETDSRQDGVFPLITNTKLKASEVLSHYKNQPYLEKRFSTLKSVLEVAPIYLKKEDRIEAIMFLYIIALMIISLIERKIRHNMKKEKIDTVPILPEKRKTATPTWAAIAYFFRNIQIAVVKNKGIIQATLKGLNKVHEIVLSLLEVPKAAYYSDTGVDWFAFYAK
jgi:transposase